MAIGQIQGTMIRQYHASLLNFHNDHVIQCPNENCKSFLTKYVSTRLRSNHNHVYGGIDSFNRQVKQYVCLLCGRTFICCVSAHRNMKLRRLVHLVAETKRRLKHYENEIERYYH